MNVKMMATTGQEHTYAQTTGFAGLAGHHYLALTTFRKNGTPVMTPVWFVADGGRLAVWTAADSGKAKRLRRNARVTLGPCTHSGKLLGEVVEGQARFVPAADAEPWQQAFEHKYGWQQKLFTLLWKVQGHAHTHLEITPVEC